MSAMDEEAIECLSAFGFEETLARISGAIEAAGLRIFARIDHAENARKAGLEMPPATVLIYGNAKGGTPVMLAAPPAALDLPLRVLVRQAGAGVVVAFHPITPILQRAGATEQLARTLEGAQRILVKAIQP